MTREKFKRGEKRMLYGGRLVTVLESVGFRHVKTLNEFGTIEMVGRYNFVPLKDMPSSEHSPQIS